MFYALLSALCRLICTLLSYGAFIFHAHSSNIKNKGSGRGNERKRPAFLRNSRGKVGPPFGEQKVLISS